jgi:hypothetical protein
MQMAPFGQKYDMYFVCGTFFIKELCWWQSKFATTIVEVWMHFCSQIVFGVV